MEMTKIEQDFQNLIIYLETNYEKQVQKLLKEISIEDIPEKYKDSYKFYLSLSGDSRNFLFKIAKNPNNKKKYIKTKK